MLQHNIFVFDCSNFRKRSIYSVENKSDFDADMSFVD